MVYFEIKHLRKQKGAVVKYKGTQLKIYNSAKNTLKDFKIIVTTCIS